MKRTLLISLATAACLVACAQRSDLEKKGRRQDGTGTQAKPTLDNADNVSLKAGQPLPRKIILGDKEVETTVLCTDNLAANLKRTERIKVQGQSQVMVRQTKNQKNPERDEAGNITESQGFYVIQCAAPSADLTQLIDSNKDHVLQMVQGQKQTLAGKFSMATEDLQQVVIGCASQEDLKNAPAILSSKDERIRADFIMAPKSKMILSTDKGVVLLTCDQNAPEKALDPVKNPNGEIDPEERLKERPTQDPLTAKPAPAAEPERDSDPKQKDSTQQTTHPKDQMHQGGERTEEPREGRAADFNAGVNVND